jgi:hypothetical protein
MSRTIKTMLMRLMFNGSITGSPFNSPYRPARRFNRGLENIDSFQLNPRHLQPPDVADGVSEMMANGISFLQDAVLGNGSPDVTLTFRSKKRAVKPLPLELSDRLCYALTLRGLPAGCSCNKGRKAWSFPLSADRYMEPGLRFSSNFAL